MITIVSGVPRSGTSLMMQRLVAGGMTALSDGERRADTNNRRAYLEWSLSKQLPNDPACIAEGEGKAVKVHLAAFAFSAGWSRVSNRFHAAPASGGACIAR